LSKHSVKWSRFGPQKQPYIGRYAPTPSGPLHFGSLVAAVGSYLQARKNKGLWLLRIEDIDPPREVPGATTAIIHTLEAYGFEWDGDISYQSQRLEYYAAALTQLKQKQQLYACSCSRKFLLKTAQHGQYGVIYPGTCRHNHSTELEQQHSLRLKTQSQKTCFTDLLQGDYCQNIATDIGDFIVKRSDGLYSYQLAIVVDDMLQGITEIVRGADLLDSTPRQIYLQQQLDYPSPNYMHLPIACNSQGQKLSKQHHAKPLTDKHPVLNLCKAMKFLGFKVTTEIKESSIADFWTWAIDIWDISKVPTKNDTIVSS